MLREVDLISYLPHFVREYREIQKIMIAENPEIQMVEDETEKVKNNSFILFCDENGIARFEKVLKIVPNPDDNLEGRISRVIVRWNDGIPYTYKGLIKKLDILCGVGNYTLNANFDEYELEIIVHLPLSGQSEELEYLLSYMIPANIYVTSRNNLEYIAQGTVYGAATNVVVKQFEITSELNHKIEAEGRLKQKEQ